MAAGKTVLVVDDDRIFWEGLAAVLRQVGYQALTAASGLEALAFWLAPQPPDLVILDMLLPALDGWQLMAERAADPALARVPVLLLTAIGVASRGWAADLGATSFLHKPIAVDDLLREIHRLCPLEPPGSRRGLSQAGVSLGILQPTP
jgi:two-component system, chemotaxis family, chemotaxis protein CheY